MTFDSSLDELLTDTITIEPWSSQDADLKPTFGTSVSYPAFVELSEKHFTDADGRQFTSHARAVIKDRVFVDLRSRVTLPSGFVPSQPPLRAVFSQKGLGMDHTTLVFGSGSQFGSA